MALLKPFVLLLTTALAGCAANTTSQSNVTSENPQAREFQRRVETYMQLRNDAARDTLPFESTASPGEIDAAQKALAARIRERRSGARHGDVMTPAIRAYFRRLLAAPLSGAREDSIRDVLDDDAPAPDAIPLEVNGTYPTSQPYATMPPSFLKLLPSLPKGLEFRLIQRDLILLDQAANLIVDYTRNAVPPPVK